MASSRRHVQGTLALLMAATACGGGGLGDVLGSVLGGPQPASGNVGQLVAEIQGVDTRNQRIEVRTEDGQQGRVEYDRRTTVVYQQQQYEVSALERGDIVEMHIQDLGQGRYYTDRILVRQSVQERQGATGTDRVVQVSGTVRQIEHRRGWFDLDTSRGTVTVTLPYNPPGDVVREFERLSRGSRTSVEGYLITDDRVELIRFRAPDTSELSSDPL